MSGVAEIRKKADAASVVSSREEIFSNYCVLINITLIHRISATYMWLLNSDDLKKKYLRN